MILTAEELDSLVRVENSNPHALLGMHPTADGKAIIVRAADPEAERIEVVPTHEKTRPRIKLKKIHPSGIFEGSTTEANAVYAYDLVVTDRGGQKRQFRDCYSFLPTLGEADLYLFGQRNELRIYEKLGAQSRLIDGVPGTSFA